MEPKLQWLSWRVEERWRRNHSASRHHRSSQWLSVSSALVPVISFGGGQSLFGFPRTSPEVNRTMAMWGFWMPGFMQFLTGVYLLVGLTWFNVFGNAAPL